MTAKRAQPAGRLRFPAFITLALALTVCDRCTGRPPVLSGVIDGIPRRLDPLPLALPDGLAAAVAGQRWVAVVRPWGWPIANKAKPGHWWVVGIGGTGHRPTLLAEHEHGASPLPADVDLAAGLIARLTPPELAPASDPNQPPPV